MTTAHRDRSRASAGPPPAPSIDAAALAAELRATVGGEVRFDAGSRALYATDASNYRQTPIGVVGPRDDGRPPVLLWPDTFNNHFHPETARAAVDVLAAAGYRVLIPPRSFCRGRPLYDWGMLGLARRLPRQALTSPRPRIAVGIPLVVLEPSCLAVFRDEMTNLLPHDEDAKRLRGQTFTLAEFLQTVADDYQPPPLAGKALLHGHCHQKALMGLEAEAALLPRLGLDLDVLDSGCRGMAGAFGFERGEHYRVSIAAGERVLLPTVRAAPAATLLIADGFSCREQIAQTTDRRALHLAQVLQMALQGRAAGADEHPTGGD